MRVDKSLGPDQNTRRYGRLTGPGAEPLGNRAAICVIKNRRTHERSMDSEKDCLVAVVLDQGSSFQEALAETRRRYPLSAFLSFSECGSRHCDALDRRPQRTSPEQTTITTPTLMKPVVTRLSCQGWPLRPAAVIGDRAAVPKTAASAVTNQFM